MSYKDFKGFDTLTDIERKLWRNIYSKGAIPFIRGRAGEGKSAIISSIAKKLDFQLIDLRLSLLDELSVGLFPIVDKDEYNDYKTFDYAIPKWAVLSNERPTIINFEELNRCRQSVMDAVLGIINERTISNNFKFNDNVYMVATGNLGNEDGTVVADFDKALINRLCIINHELTFNDWLNGYANENVEPIIIDFIKNNLSYFYKLSKEDNEPFTTPRSWSNLSNHIKESLGNNYSNEELIEIITQDGSYYVGSITTKLIKYINSINQISHIDILDYYNEKKSIIEALSRPRKSELLSNIIKLDFNDLSDKQINNLIYFLHGIGDDEVGSFIKSLYQKINEQDEVIINILSNKESNYTRLFKEFKTISNYVIPKI